MMKVVSERFVSFGQLLHFRGGQLARIFKDSQLVSLKRRCGERHRTGGTGARDAWMNGLMLGISLKLTHSLSGSIL